MAHKKGVGSSRNGRDSNPQFLGDGDHFVFLALDGGQGLARRIGQICKQESNVEQSWSDSPAVNWLTTRASGFQFSDHFLPRIRSSESDD